MIRISIPATCANIGPGFDVFGMALEFSNSIEIEKSTQFSIFIEGEGKGVLPETEENLAIKALRTIYKGDLNQFSIRFKNKIPLARGLGSSATAIVGGLVAGNLLSGEPYSEEELLKMAIEIEGHPDNVTPAMLGGFTISYKVENAFRSVKIIPPEFYVYLIIPGYKLETERMRSVLPDTYKREDIIYNVARASLVVTAFLNGDISLLKEAISDRIHEPYRGKFIKGYFELRDLLLRDGSGVCAISGSGPTISCFSERDDLDKKLTQYMEDLEISGKLIKTKPSLEGVKIESA